MENKCYNKDTGQMKATAAVMISLSSCRVKPSATAASTYLPDLPELGALFLFFVRVVMLKRLSLTLFAVSQQ